MANVLDRYGIKEVADVTFYKLNSNGIPTYPVLYLDTLKVSTIEQTADEATANGGKGNPPLVIWDYNKDITVTLEDALFSAKSLAIMFGDGTLKDFASGEALIMKTEVFAAEGTEVPDGSETTKKSGWDPYYTGPDGKRYKKINPKFYRSEEKETDATVVLFTIGEKYFCTFDLAVKGNVIDVSANSFPGTYYVTGDTYARSDITGDDEFFQFIIPKAKVQSENTITLEADGDPSTFNMSLHVMRPEDGVMMKLVKYEAINPNAAAESDTVVYHNHYLKPEDQTKKEAGVDSGIENGTLKLKTPPVRALYDLGDDSVDAADTKQGLELLKYNSSTNTWDAVSAASIDVYKADADEAITLPLAETTVVRFKVGTKYTDPVTIKVAAAANVSG